MSGSAALPGLAALLALTGCFQVNLGDCRITCNNDNDCPSDSTCHGSQPGGPGLCASSAVSTCNTSGIDAGGSDGDAGGSLPPRMLCHGSVPCFPLPDAVRANIVLLLWPDNLPAVGSPVQIWHDESGYGNDAQALYMTAPPHATANGVQLDKTQIGSGLKVEDSSSLDLGSGDFAVIVVAGLSSGQTTTLFSKSDGARTDSRQVELQWHQDIDTMGWPTASVDDALLVSEMEWSVPSFGVHCVRRRADHVELRLNKSVLKSADLSPGTSTTNSENVWLGTASLSAYTVDSIGAVIILRGPVADDDLESLESFLSVLNPPT
jgi:hypothetical protein